MAVKLLENRQQPSQDHGGLHLSGQLIIGLLFLLALFAFELFNFDTTQFALENLLGTVSFAGLRWATILAIAFCAIDFAGLLRFFLPEETEGETPVEVWYLMGAWLLGATMNALMTWWAISISLLDHNLGNEVLSRQQLLEIVPVFVAVLVWLTRILFVGAFTVAGGYLFNFDQLRPVRQPAARTAARAGSAARIQPLPANARPKRATPAVLPAAALPTTRELPPFLTEEVERADEDAESERDEMKTQVSARPVGFPPRRPAPVGAGAGERTVR